MVKFEQMVIGAGVALVAAIIAHIFHPWAAMPIGLVAYAITCTLFYIHNQGKDNHNASTKPNQ